MEILSSAGVLVCIVLSLGFLRDFGQFNVAGLFTLCLTYVLKLKLIYYSKSCNYFYTSKL